MSSKISKLEFFTKVNHASPEYLFKLSKIMEESCLVPVNPNQDRFELIQTIEALYYKDKDKVHENSFLPPNHIDRFDFGIHYSCPFSEQSVYKYPYSIMADSFGYGKVFLRKDAIKVIQEIANIPYDDARETVYRIFQILTDKLRLRKKGLWGESIKEVNLILYEVESRDGDKVTFKERL